MLLSIGVHVGGGGGDHVGGLDIARVVVENIRVLEFRCIVCVTNELWYGVPEECVPGFF